MSLTSIVGSRFLRFGSFGAIATLIHLIVFTILVEKLRVPAVAASIPAFLCAMSFSYTANSKWTFRVSVKHGTHLPRYAVVSLFGLGLNILITYLVVNIMEMWYGFALMLVVVAVPLMTYLLNRHWTYREATTRSVTPSKETE